MTTQPSVSSLPVHDATASPEAFPSAASGARTGGVLFRGSAAGPRWALIGILILYSVAVFQALLWFSPPGDEQAHVRAGLAMWTRERYVDPTHAWWTAVDPLHPPLDMVPAWLAHVSGQPFDCRGDLCIPFEHLLVARLFNLFLGSLLLVWVAHEAQRWGGGWAGPFAALVLALHPVFLGHCAIVSSDLDMAFGCWVVLVALGRVFLPPPPDRPGGGRRVVMQALGLGAALSLALICKMGNLALIPVMGGVACLAAFGPARRAGEASGRALGRTLTVTGGAVALGVLGAAAIYHGTHRPEQPPVRIAGRTIQVPWGQAFVVAAATAVQLKGIQPQIVYRGRLEAPRPRHHLWGYLYKTPLGLLALGPWVVVGAIRRMRHGGRGERRVLLYGFSVFVGLGLLFTTRGFYWGVRHELPLIVLGAAGAGVAVGGWGTIGSRRGRRWALGCLMLCVIEASVEVGRSAPWFLSFFNPVGQAVPLAFVDADGDWGEGLWALAAWQRQHDPDQPLWLASFGPNRPGDFGVQFRGLFSPFGFVALDPEQDRTRGRDPQRLNGWVAIGRTELAGRYLPAVGADPDFYAAWRRRRPVAVVAGCFNLYDRRAGEP